jgi:uncharacterized damage-inducible protein DinB
VREEPPDSGPELVLLTGFLDWQRATVLQKAEGLSRTQLAQPHPPSSLTIGGLLHHLALVEDDWFRVRFAGLPATPPWDTVDWAADRDWEFHTAADVDPEQLRDRYRAACARSREVVAQAGSLDQLSVGTSRAGTHWDLRWILVHVLEETARHNGHADLIRESIDGTTGE